MSTNRNRTASKDCDQNRWYNIADFKWKDDPWDDDYYCHYPKYRRGYKNPIKNIFGRKVREYRTWKYNRKKQYKE